MTLEALFSQIVNYRDLIIFLILIAPWLTWLICFIIPGYWEEPYLLSFNLWLALTTMLFWVGYLAYATNTGGWSLVVKQADFVLLIVPPYYLFTSLWISKQRMPLDFIPAFRTLEGFIFLAGSFLALSWILSRIRIIFFSAFPFSTFLVIIAVILGIGYLGYRQMVGK
ncbi:putative membrane protein [Lyngbya aestuarii BL J]|uniref:Putative membrane protein n=1 Tax=Lyngbya aestuarii BL J TaxID=1348334 RepID=U7QPJ9_9CYAN|nr:hypothetical protein [Lyngbya aestuarii]ERT08331.1 putative membrane protein [Lyngbya aestuarii BL J]